jgi:hypothetical protein
LDVVYPLLAKLHQKISDAIIFYGKEDIAASFSAIAARTWSVPGHHD